MAETFSHSRSLPPVESRESVIARSSQVSWEVLDLVDGLSLGIPCSGRIHNDERHPRQHESDQPPLSKKRRLLVNPAAASIAEDESARQMQRENDRFRIRQTLLAASPSPTPGLSFGESGDTLFTDETDCASPEWNDREFPLSRNGTRNTIHTNISNQADKQGDESPFLAKELLQRSFRLPPTETSTANGEASHITVSQSASVEIFGGNGRPTSSFDKQAGRISQENSTADDRPPFENTDQMSPGQIEELLDIAQQGAGGNQQTCPLSSDARSSSNPFSRMAAECWRSQDRHLSYHDNSAGGIVSRQTQELEEGEKRLRQLTKLHRRHENHGVSSSTMAYDDEDMPQSGRLSSRPLSGLELLALKRKSSDEEPPVHNSMSLDPIRTPFAASLLRMEDLTLPKNFDRLSPQHQDLIVEHERMKERIRDLETLDDTYRAIAQLRSLGDLSSSEQLELQKVRKYLVQVIDQKAPGKLRRQVISQIRHNMKRRANKFDAPDAACTDIWYRRLLGDERIATLHQELDSLRETELDVRAQRLAKGRHLKDAIRVRHAKTAKLKPNRSQTNATENRRVAQYAMQDMRAQQIKVQLQLFDRHHHPDSRDIDHQEGDANQEQNDSRSEVSEDESGAQFVFGSGKVSRGHDALYTSPTSPLPDTSAIEDENSVQPGVQYATDEPGDENILDPKTSRTEHRKLTAAELDLLDQQFRRQQLQPEALTPESRISRREFRDDLSDETSSVASSPDFDIPNDRFISVYSVYRQFSGSIDHENGDRYTIGNEYSLNHANKRMAQEVQVVMDEYERNPQYEPGFRTHRIEQVDGLDKHYLTFGRTEQASAVIAATIYTEQLAKRAYIDAKEKELIQDKAIYNVYWQRTTSKSYSSLPNSDALTDPADTTPGEISELRWDEETETIHYSQVQHFNNLIKANQHAREEFMMWFATFFQGPFHQRTLEDKEAEMAEYLDRLGSIGLWDQEDEFVLSTVSDSTGVGAGSGDGDGNNYNKDPGGAVEHSKTGTARITPTGSDFTNINSPTESNQVIETSTQDPNHSVGKETTTSPAAAAAAAAAGTGAQPSISENPTVAGPIQAPQVVHHHQQQHSKGNKVLITEKYRVWVEKRPVWGVIEFKRVPRRLRME